MMCSMCEAHICETIRKAVPNAKKVFSFKTKKETTFPTEEAVDAEALKAAVNASGYTCTDVAVSAFEKKGWFGRI